MHRRALLATLAAGAAGLGGCAGRTRTPTPTAGDDTPETPAPAGREPDTPRETPRSDAPTPRSAGAAARWDAFLPGRYTLAAPAVTDDRLLIGSGRALFSLRRADGERAWAADLGALAHQFTPALVPGGAVAVARDVVGGSALSDDPGVVAAVDRDGTERWRTTAPVTAAPVAADGLVYVVTTSADRVRLRALAAADGERAWAVDVGGPDDEGVAASAPLAGRVLVGVTRTRSDGSQRTRLVAVGAGADGGDRAWTAATDGEAVAAPTVHGDRAYLGTDAGRIHAFRPDGSRAWRVGVGAGVEVAPAVGRRGPLVVAGRRLVALEPGGAERWTTAVGDPRRTGLATVDGTAYVGGERLTAVGADGTVRWQFGLGGVAGAFGPPVRRGGTVYTGACIKQEGTDPYDHHVYAMDAVDG